MKSNSFEKFLQTWSALEKRFMPAYVWDSDPLTLWRERILFIICFIPGALGPIALIPSVLLAYYESLWHVIILDICAYMVIVLILVFRNLAFQIRAVVTCFVLYSLGIGILFTLGPIGAGYIWLFAASVLISAILGLSAAIWTLVLNSFTLFSVGVYVILGNPAWAVHLQNAYEKWMVMTVNFILLNTIVTVTTAFMLNGLKKVLIHEQQISASLRESEERFRLLAENTIDCIWLMDLNTTFIYVNPAIQDMMKYKPEEWIGTSLAEHTDDKNLEKMMNEITGVLENLPLKTDTTFEAVMFDLSTTIINYH